MNLNRGLTAALVGTTLITFAVSSATAATVNITGGVLPPFPGYGNASGNNNVVNGNLGPVPPAGTAVGASGLFDATNGATYLGGASAVVQSTAPLYVVQYTYAGSESGDRIQFTSPAGVFTEGTPPVPDNGNNNFTPGSPQVGPIPLGTTPTQSSPILSFSFQDLSIPNSVANGANNPTNTGLPNMIFSYLDFLGGNRWNLTSTPTDWFLAGLNDSGSRDDNHDDMIIIGHVVAVPLPAALGLFAGGLGLMGFLGRRRKRQTSANLAVA